MNEDVVFISHIRDAMQKAMRYVEGMTKESFLQDSKTQDAVIRQFEIIGEATKRFSATIRDAKPEIPWRDMAGMRDKLIHDYIGTDVFRVWGIVSERVPEVLPLVHQLLDELDINSP